MNILFTVCGRGGSKGVKSKNIKNFLGVPLFEYTLSSINLYKEKNIKKFDNIHTAISTDSSEFIEFINSRESNNFHIINRSIDLAEDSTPKMYAIKDALEKSEIISGLKYDVIVDLDITSPIRTIKDIEDVVNKEIENNDYDVVFSVTDSRRNPYFNMVVEEGKYVKKVLESNYTARQQAPIMYDMNASIYAYSRKFLLSGSNSPLEGKAGMTEMMNTGIIDIDSDNDFNLMEVIAKWIMENKEEYKYLIEVKH
jgi:CMP-N,N'-diacetyllegionaminic acid synthase